MSLGPGFRVTWCDCSRQPQLRVIDYCGFCLCSCPTCGGSPLARSLVTPGSNSYFNHGADGAGLSWSQDLRRLWATHRHTAAAFILGFLSAMALAVGLSAPHRCLPIIVAASTVELVVGPPPLPHQALPGGKAKVQ